jgi:hypothetical protein
MTDLVQTAMNYRQQLLADISKVDEFLRIGEYLMRLDRSASGTGEAREAAKPAKPAEQVHADIPAKADTPAKADAPAAETVQARPAAAAESAKPAQTDTAETAPRRSLAFRGACETSELELRRNIA